MTCGWEGNRRFVVALAMRCRLQWFELCQGAMIPVSGKVTVGLASHWSLQWTVHRLQ